MISGSFPMGSDKVRVGYFILMADDANVPLRPEYVGLHHDADQLLDRGVGRIPTEFIHSFAGIALQVTNFAGAEEIRMQFEIALRVIWESSLAAGHADKLGDGVSFTAGDHII